MIGSSSDRLRTFYVAPIWYPFFGAVAFPLCYRWGACDLLRLRHRVANGLMVSDTNNEQEGWPLVDPLGTSSCTSSVVAERRSTLPPIVHYCQVSQP